MKKKSIQIKSISGTLRPDRLPGKVGSAEGETIPESYLSEPQRAYFDEIAAHLKANGVLMEVDRLVISQTAIWLDIFSQAVEIIKREGQTVDKPSGVCAVHPAVRVLEAAQQRLNPLFRSLGMSPGDREALATFQSRPEDDRPDPLGDLLQN